MKRTNARELGKFVLSLRTNDLINHNAIKVTRQGYFYISNKVKFRNLNYLIQHYNLTVDGLDTFLRKTCTWVIQLFKNRFIVLNFSVNCI